MENYAQNEIAKIKEAKRILKNTNAKWIKDCSVDNAIHFTAGDIFEDLTLTPVNGSSLIIQPVDGYSRWSKVNIIAELNKKIEMIENQYYY
jgi:DNA modification methylase